MKKVVLALLVILASFGFSYSLLFEGGYLYYDGNDFSLETNSLTIIPVKFSTDTKFDGTFYTKSSLRFDQTFDNSYVYFDGQFFTASFFVPLAVVNVNEAYVETYTNFGDLKVGKFVEKLVDSEVFKVYDKIGSYLAGEKLSITGAKYAYTTNYGTLGLYTFSTFESLPSSTPASYVYTVKTNLPDETKMAILASMQGGGLPIVFKDQKFADHFSYAINWSGNVLGVDYGVLLAYKKSNYLVVDKILEDGVHLKWPFVYTASLSFVYQIPSTSFIVHNYTGFESENKSTFNLPVEGLGEVEIEEKVPSVLENVFGIEYQIGTQGLIGFDGYIRLYDFEYYDSAISAYGDYKKDEFSVKGMVKYNMKSEKIDVMYEGSYNFDDYTALFARGLYSKIDDSDTNVVMIGVKVSY
jgi:hypothetical protein